MTHRSLLLEYVARAAFWIMLAASVWILLRGHNAPGGGFILGPGCALPATTPDENIDALIETAKEHGCYR